MTEVDLVNTSKTMNTSNTISSNQAGTVTPKHYDLSPIGLIVFGLIALSLMYFHFLMYLEKNMLYGSISIVVIYAFFMIALGSLGVLLNIECKKAFLKTGDSSGNAK